jgi:hypothetical protein
LRRAAVAVFLISIVALFVAFENRIATDCIRRAAIPTATVAVKCIAIVTDLFRIEGSVAALPGQIAAGR